MDWGKLKSFHAAAETGSLTAAALRLNVSQSAVSRQIAALEEQVGVTLFHRHARGLLMTEAGELLHRSTVKMWTEAERAHSLLQDARDKTSGELKVNAPVALGSTWLASHLSGFIEKYPDIRITLLMDDRELDLNKFQADVALRPYQPTQPDLVARKLGSLQVTVYGSLDYFKRWGEPQTPAELDRHRLIAYRQEQVSAFEGINTPLLAGRAPDDPRTPHLIMSNLNAMLYAVESGLGLAMLPEYLVQGRDKLKPVLPELSRIGFELYFVYPIELKGSRRVAAFRDFLVKETANLA